MKTIHLSKSESRKIRQQINGDGGHQRLLRLLNAIGQTDAAGRLVLDLTAELEADIRRYALAYGRGGYQGRFKAIITAIDREESAF